MSAALSSKNPNVQLLTHPTSVARALSLSGRYAHKGQIEIQGTGSRTGGYNTLQRQVTDGRSPEETLEDVAACGAHEHAALAALQPGVQMERHASAAGGVLVLR